MFGRTKKRAGQPNALLAAVVAAFVTGATVAPMAAGYTWFTAKDRMARLQGSCDDQSQQLARLEIRVALARAMVQLENGNFGTAADHVAQAQRTAQGPSDPLPDGVGEALATLTIEVGGDRQTQRAAIAEVARSLDAMPGA